MKCNRSNQLLSLSAPMLTILGVCLTASVQANAQTVNQNALSPTQQAVVNNLQNSSLSIKNTLSSGTAFVGAINTASHSGVIVDPNAYQSVTVSQDQVTKYNTSLATYQSTPFSGSAQFFINQANTAFANMQSAIGQLATSAVDLQKAVTVNQMVASVTDTPTAKATQQAIAAAGLDTPISSASVTAYNTSLASVNSYATQAAAFMQAANSVSITGNVDKFASQYNSNIAYANAQFSYATGALTVDFGNGMALTQTGVLNAYYEAPAQLFASTVFKQ
jgi:hypothetical protein